MCCLLFGMNLKYPPIHHIFFIFLSLSRHFFICFVLFECCSFDEAICLIIRPVVPCNLTAISSDKFSSAINSFLPFLMSSPSLCRAFFLLFCYSKHKVFCSCGCSLLHIAYIACKWSFSSQYKLSTFKWSEITVYRLTVVIVSSLHLFETILFLLLLYDSFHVFCVYFLYLQFIVANIMIGSNSMHTWMNWWHASTFR